MSGEGPGVKRDGENVFEMASEVANKGSGSDTRDDTDDEADDDDDDDRVVNLNRGKWLIICGKRRNLWIAILSVFMLARNSSELPKNAIALISELGSQNREIVHITRSSKLVKYPFPFEANINRLSGGQTFKTKDPK